jgi:hypothetical protein
VFFYWQRRAIDILDCHLLRHNTGRLFIAHFEGGGVCAMWNRKDTEWFELFRAKILKLIIGVANRQLFEEVTEGVKPEPRKSFPASLAARLNS